MKTVGITTIIILLFILFSLTPAQALPLYPHQFYGDVTIDGEAAPLGTLVSVKVNGIESGSVTIWEEGKYGWGRPGPPDYDYQANLLVQGYHVSNGDLIAFYINNVEADQTAIFQTDIKTKLDLTVALVPPIHTWSLCAPGFFPKHLPDSYYGQIVLADLVDVSSEVQGVYWYNCNAMEWKFWAPGAPGCTLETLGGGHTYDYMVSVTGHCDWDIPLP